MKLVLVNYEYPPLGGGAGNATAHLARALHRLGHQVTVVTSSFADLPARENDDGAEIVRISSVRARIDRASLGEMASYVLRACIEVPRLARSRSADGCIVFFSVPCGPVGWITRRLVGTPYVVALRGGDVPGTEAGIRRLQWLLTPFRRAILTGAVAVTANSRGLAALSKRADPFPVDVIENGVDAALFQPATNPSSASLAPVLFAGRFNTQKNLFVLLEQFARARLEVPQLRLVMVGDGPLRAALEERAVALGIGDAVEWRGWLGKAQLAALYRQCSVFVNPSLYEGMPNTVLEAMASGLPVIASAVPGNDELVEHKRTGLLFDLCTPDALSTGLVALARDATLRRQYGAAARSVVESSYSWDSAAQRYSAYFRTGTLHEARSI